MTKSIIKAIAAIGVGMLVMVAWQRVASPAAAWESELQLLNGRLADGIRAKDIDKIMACYQNSDKLVVFDLIPPLQYKGWDSYKANWEGFLKGCTDSPTWDESELHFMGGQTWAFSHSIVHMTCTMAQDKKMDITLRVTNGYANFKGKWLIAHQHISVPVDPMTGKADLQSKP